MTRFVRKLLAGCALGLALAGCAHDPVRLEYQSAYDNAVLSPGIKFLALPDAVKSTIRAQAGMAEISDIGRYEVHGSTFYKVWFQRSGSFPPLYILPDGSTLNSDLTVSMHAPLERYEGLAGHEFGTLSFADLPPPVAKTVKLEAATYEIQRIEQTGPDTNRVFTIEFKGANAPAPMVIDQSGRRLER